jgi:glutamine---fructose-6-phosphate transaminase (isomerizing)
MIERLARVPVEVDYASEWRYRDPIIDPTRSRMLISQSGETADTIAAQREAKAKGSKTLAICNVVGSMITREAAGTIYTHAGPEIGVASTKAFTGQLTALYLFAMYLARCAAPSRRPSPSKRSTNLLAFPANSNTFSRTRSLRRTLAKTYGRAQDFSFSAAAFTIRSRSKARSS